MVSRRSLGDLTAFVGADASDLDRTLLQAERRFDQFSDELGGSFDRPAQGVDRFADSLDNLGGAGSLAATALSGPGGIIVAIGAIGTAVVSAGRRLAEWNRELTLNARISGTTREEYAALSNVFQTIGADADSLRDVFNDINERLADAREGAREYADAFERLGISVNALGDVGTVDRLFLLAEAFERVDDNVAQLSANEIAGEQGQRLLAIVRELGSEELIRQYERFLQAGTISEESSQAIVRYELALRRLRQEVIGAFFDEVDRRVQIGVGGWELLGNAARNYQGILQSLGILQAENATITVEANERYSEAAGAYDDATDALQRYLDAFELSRDQRPDTPIIDEIARLEAEIAALQEAERAFNRSVAERRAAAAQAARDRLEAERLLEATLDRSAADLADQQAAAFASAADSVSLLVDEVTGLDLVLGDLPDEPISQLEEAAIAALPAIQNLFNNLIRGGQDAEDVLLSVVSLVLELGLGNLSAGRGFFQFAGGFQFGGFIPPGQTGLVGERGPELVTAGAQGATVTPEGGSVINYVTVNSGDPAAIATMFDELEARIYANLPLLQTTPGHPLNISTRIASA